MRRAAWSMVTLLLALGAPAPPAQAQTVGTSFTYQGRLLASGLPATGDYDMRFEVFTLESGGAALGSQTLSNVPVASGLFTVQLPLASAVLAGGEWLGIAVAPGGSGGPFVPMATRQQLTPSPSSFVSGLALDVKDNAVTSAKILGGTVVRSLNGQTDAVSIAGTNGLSASASGGTVTVTSNATSANVGDTIVSRGPTGGFSAGTVALSGNLDLPASASATAGMLTKGGAPFVHNVGTVNTFVGESAGNVSLTGLANTGVGSSTLTLLADGSANSAFGFAALGPNTSGSSNSAFGAGAMQTNSTGSNNAAFGTFALASNPSGGSNSAFGDLAMANATGSSNSAFGASALGNASGGQNSAFGVSALEANTTGFLNSAFGASALRSNVDGGANVAFGFEALRDNTSGFQNVGLGSQALAENTTGGGNIGIGSFAVGSNTTGLGNIGIGEIALANLGGGDMNIAIGLQTGTSLTSGSHNIYLGAGAGINGSESNTIRLGNPGIHTATHLAGDVDVPSNRKLSFGAQTRQMLDLWGSVYGLGVQSGVLYFRADAFGNNGFAWYRGGVHDDGSFNNGGGTTLMTLNPTGLTVNGTFVSSSDRAAKQDIRPLDSEAVLEKVAALPLSEWSYRADPAVRHVGPMAQDFHAAFGLGSDDRHIATVDADGVALAAIQALNRRLEAEIRSLRAELEALRSALQADRTSSGAHGSTQNR